MARGENGDKIFGRGENDHERLFPKFTTAQAASTGQVTVNGKTLKLWEFSQLETLKPAVLRQRAMAIRDAVGEAQCPPMPSAQTHDMIRWILHMQSELQQKETDAIADTRNRNAMQGYGPSASFVQESQGRPILPERASSPRQKTLPFGPKKIDDSANMEATRDHYGDLLEQKKEFQEVQQRGIATMRVGGEGRRHIIPKDNMLNDGVSMAEPAGIESMKLQGEGRKYLSCKDHLLEQQKELEAMQRGVRPEERRPKLGPESTRSGGQGMARILTADKPDTASPEPINEMPIGGERRRHINPEDHMLNYGTADAVEGTIGHGRKHVDHFAGTTRIGGAHDKYRSTWKQDPSRLMGTSLII